jgi:hypothetical protein
MKFTGGLKLMALAVGVAGVEILVTQRCIHSVFDNVVGPHPRIGGTGEDRVNSVAQKAAEGVPCVSPGLHMGVIPNVLAGNLGGYGRVIGVNRDGGPIG